ncbi:MAG: hypothetical protein ACKOX6_08480 [Bdellovibrio sp.]
MILLQYISSLALAGNLRPFSTDQVIYLTNQPGKRILAYKDYEDIRVDSDLDGKVDFWEIKRGSFDIVYHYKNGKPRYLKISKFEHGKIKEMLYVFGSNPKKKFFERAARVMNGVLDPICKEEKSVFKELEGFPKEFNKATIIRNIDSYLDDSCFKPEYDNQKDVLIGILKDVIIDGTEAKNSFHECIQSQPVVTKIAGKDSNTILGLQVLSAKYSLQMKRMAQADESSKGLITCEMGNETKANYKENGKITFLFAKDQDLSQKNETLKSLLRHEFLHKAGLTDEKFTDKLVSLCSSSKDRFETKKVTAGNNKSSGLIIDNVNDASNTASKTQAASTINSKPFSMTVVLNDDILNSVASDTAGNTKSETASADNAKTSSQRSRAPASATGGGSSGVDMKSEIAQAQAIAPSAEKLAQTKVDRSPEGIQSAVKESVAESAPVLRMANQVMGAANTPAVASSAYVAEVPKADITATPSYESGSSSGGSSSSDSSSSRRYQSKNGRYQSSSETVASSEGPKVITTSRNGLAAGERVVEEVDLTKGTNFKTTNAATPSRGQSNASREAPADRITAAPKAPIGAVPAAPANPGGELASPGAISIGGGGSSVSLSGPTNINVPENRRVSGTRAPASTASAQNTPTSSREEIVTFLSSGSYSVTRSKLRDAKFVNTLKSNKVTIIDLYGNSFGASKGDVIFLDEGNKFVRQK